MLNTTSNVDDQQKVKIAFAEGLDLISFRISLF
jgi:hypothetical protein